MAPTTTGAKKAPAASKKTAKSKPKHVALSFEPIPGASSQRTKSASLPKFSLKGREDSPEPEKIENVKGKGKPVLPPAPVIDHDELWVDKYAPQAEEDLAVHKRKIQDVRRWLEEALGRGESVRLKKYRRLLVLTGPAGAGKTATLRVLAREMDLEMVEWSGAQDEQFADEEYAESLAMKFDLFLSHATRSLTFAPPAASSSTAPSTPKQRLILLEDLPNILHLPTRDAFHAALNRFIAQLDGPPVVLIVSESGARGVEKGREDRWDIRSVLPPKLIDSPYTTEIPFNPLAPTILRPALHRILERTHASSRAQAVRPSLDTIELVVDSSMGDIRAAIMALQFACRVVVAGSGGLVGKTGGRGRGKEAMRKRRGKESVGEGVRTLIESVTRQEQMLALFHTIGKVLYNKRVGDDPEQDEDADAETSSRGSLPLPPHLSAFSRRPSKVDPNVLYADAPVDGSMLSVYLHQNYTQFCDSIDELAGAMEWLSYSEACIKGETEYPALPVVAEYAFQLVTRGMLMALPSPTLRAKKKLLKSEYWEFARKERAGLDALRAWGGDGERAWCEGVKARLGIQGQAPRAICQLGQLTYSPPVRMDPRSSQLLGEADIGEVESDLSASQGSNEPEYQSEEEDGEKEKDGGWIDEDDIEEFQEA